jgi:hypothetical protein
LIIIHILSSGKQENSGEFLPDSVHCSRRFFTCRDGENSEFQGMSKEKRGEYSLSFLGLPQEQAEGKLFCSPVL